MNTITVEWEVFRGMCDCSNYDTQECEHERSKDGNCSLEACPLSVRTVSTLARPKEKQLYTLKSCINCGNYTDTCSSNYCFLYEWQQKKGGEE